eukprot:TRINITY_DN7913_c0_g1_i1.p1 TRINITY_DN7913_c0_g1~~TRINITY_DN7913_c0_g1_i1.p1  ORF type:complete len:875 (-),score=279.11 TRINITY_DN7913_c0_g1_i1:138-2762(-)
MSRRAGNNYHGRAPYATSPRGSSQGGSDGFSSGSGSFSHSRDDSRSGSRREDDHGFERSEGYRDDDDYTPSEHTAMTGCSQGTRSTQFSYGDAALPARAALLEDKKNNALRNAATTMPEQVPVWSWLRQKVIWKKGGHEVRPLTPEQQDEFVTNSIPLNMFQDEEGDDHDPPDPNEFDDDYTGRNRAKKTLCGSLFKKELIAPTRARMLRMKAKENLGVEPPNGEENLKIKTLRRFGLLEFALRVEIKKVRAKVEDPAFPFVRNLVDTLRFECFSGVLILIGAIFLAIDTYYPDAERKPTYLVVGELIMVFIFCVEIALRMAAWSWAWVFTPLNFFDVTIILVTGVLIGWITNPMGIDTGVTQRLSALRVLRVVRLVRAVRLMQQFSDLWTMVQGMVSSVPLLFWAFVIIGCVQFMFAVAMIDIIARSDTFKEDEEIQMFWGDLPASMFSLFQVMTLDSWAAKARPILEKMPLPGSILLGLFLGFAGIVLTNLMTAIVVKKSFDAHHNDTEAIATQKQLQYIKQRQELMLIFQEMDEDGSGMLSREEFVDVLDDIAFIRKIAQLDIEVEELPDVFEILDDGDGLVSADEFIEGLTKMQGAAMSKDMMKAQKKLQVAAELGTDVVHWMHNTSSNHLDYIEDNLDRTHTNIVQMQIITAELLEQLNKLGLRHTVKQTAVDFPELPKPSLDDFIKKEKHLRRLEELCGEVQSEIPEGPGQRPVLPQSWILRTLTDKEEEQKKKESQMSSKQLLKELQKQQKSQQKSTGAHAVVNEQLEILGLDIDMWTPTLLKQAKVPRDELMKKPSTVQRFPHPCSAALDMPALPEEPPWPPATSPPSTAGKATPEKRPSKLVPKKGQYPPTSLHGADAKLPNAVP